MFRLVGIAAVIVAVGVAAGCGDDADGDRRNVTVREIRASAPVEISVSATFDPVVSRLGRLLRELAGAGGHRPAAPRTIVDALRDRRYRDAVCRVGDAADFILAVAKYRAAAATGDNATQLAAQQEIYDAVAEQLSRHAQMQGLADDLTELSGGQVASLVKAACAANGLLPAP